VCSSDLLKNSNLNVLAVIPTLYDDPTETIQSLIRQTVPISRVFVGVGSRVLYEKLIAKPLENVTFVFVRPDFATCLGTRIGCAINTALSGIKLQEYDYLLKVDADTILPPNFLARNIETYADITGIFGFTMLFKVPAFIKLLNGKWPEVLGEDTYIIHLYKRHGFSIANYLLSPAITRKSETHSWRYQFNRGLAVHLLGYEPIHALALSLDVSRDGKALFLMLGFMASVIRRSKRYDFADWIFLEQVKELLRVRTLFSRVQMTFF
jgi:hypothetical protein